MVSASEGSKGATDNVPTSQLMTMANAAADGFRSLAVAVDSGRADDVGGAVCWYSSSLVPLFNGAGLFYDHLFNPDTLSAIDIYFAARQRPYSLITLDGLVADAGERLRGLGCYEVEATPAMWLDGPPTRWEFASPDLWVSHVQTQTELESFRLILSNVFYISQSEVELIMGEKVLGVPYVRHYLAWLRGTPVGTTSLVLTGNVAGIWNVGTLTEYRRHGIAAMLMHRAVSDAAALGYPSTMLLSSTEGIPLYERLGYETISTMRMFMRDRVRE